MKTSGALLLGFLLGVVATAAITGARRLDVPPPVPPPARAVTPAPAPPSEALAQENRKLREELAELRKAAVPASPPERPAAKPAPDFKAKFAEFADQGFAAFQSPEFGEFRDQLKSAGTDGTRFLMEALRSATTAGERFLAAALMESLKDASALPALVEALGKEEDLLVRRMISHAMAVLGTDAAEAPLRRAMTADADLGVRVNSAYGLAKLGREDGRRMLEEAYLSAGTPPEYRVPILSGLVDVAAPASAPIFRRILTDTKELSYLLLAITALGKMKDTDSLASLQTLSVSDSPETVRQAAKKAIDEIRK